ncbi:MAG: hypothetical protein AAF371_12260 [Pseudomonadota bacterium]
MLSGLGRHGVAVTYGLAGLLGGVVAVLIGPVLGLDDGPDAWLTPLLSGGIGYGYGWYTSRPPQAVGDEADAGLGEGAEDPSADAVNGAGEDRREQ